LNATTPVTTTTTILSNWPDNFFGHVALTINYAALGHDGDARTAAKEVLRIAPNFSTKRLARIYPYKDPIQTARVLSLLHKAGLPD
jgi:hypothetical protein